MTNPIKALEDYIGVRPKGRQLTLKEQFQTVSVRSLNQPILPTAGKWAAFTTLVSEVTTLIQGHDDRFSTVLEMFAICLALGIAVMYILQAAGRKIKAAGIY